MKQILAKLIDVTPFIIGVVIGAYIIEEIMEDLFSETLSDFVYPIAALIILGIVWYKVIPTVKSHVTADVNKINQEN